MSSEEMKLFHVSKPEILWVGHPSGRALVGLDTRLIGPTLPSAWTHASHVAQNKKKSPSLSS